MVTYGRVNSPKIYLIKTSVSAFGRQKVNDVNKTLKKIFHRDMENFAERTHKKAVQFAPKDQGYLRKSIYVEQVPTSDDMEMWKLSTKNPVQEAPDGYRRGGKDDGFDLAYWAHKSAKAASHFNNKDRYIYKAEEWAANEMKNYVRSGRYKTRLNKFKR